LVAAGSGGVVLVTNTRVVATQSANGTTTYKCQEEIDNNTGRAVVWNFDYTEDFFPEQPPGGLICNIFDGVSSLCTTEDWHETVSKSGNAKLTCRCDADSSP
jgi:hypothetical protein